MKILSLNIRHGGGQNAQALLDWSLGKTPDVLVLPEWRNNSSGRLILKALEHQGFTTASACRENPRANGILIATKYEFKSQRITSEASDYGELLLAEFSLGFRILAGYFPQGKLKAPFFQLCLDEAGRAREVPVLLIGDLNTGRNDLDVEADGTPFHCADLFESLESRGGLIDLRRATNGKLQEWTWRSKSNGFRIDHAFGNKCLLAHAGPIRCHYDHTPRNIKITDHTALFVEFSGLLAEVPRVPGPRNSDTLNGEEDMRSATG